jgi:signal transduction histidine kinase
MFIRVLAAAFMLLVVAAPVQADTAFREIKLPVRAFAIAELSEHVELRGLLFEHGIDRERGAAISEWHVSEFVASKSSVWLQLALFGTPRNVVAVVVAENGGLTKVWSERDILADSNMIQSAYWLKAPEVKSGTRLKVYLARTEPEDQLLIRDIHFWTDEARDKHLTSYSILMAAYFGALVTLLIYNLGFAIRLRSMLHGLYSLYCTAGVLLGLSQTGLIFEFGNLPLDPVWSRIISYWTIWGLSSTTTVFCAMFLEGKYRNPVVMKAVWLTMGLGFLTMFPILLGFNEVLAVRAMNIGTLIPAFLIAGTTIVAAIRGSSAARLLLVAFTPLLIIGVLRALIAERGFFLVNGLQIATVFDAVVLSWGLTERIRRIREHGLQAMAENAARSDYFANMAHELRTPLSAIIGFSSALKAGYGGPLEDKQKSYVADIEDAGNHLLTLINDVLDMSKSEAGKLEPYEEDVDVGDQVLRSLPFVREQAHQLDIRLVPDIEPELPAMKLDARMLRQIVINLLSNAVKFTPDHGTVTISARRSDDGDLLIIVADTGVGMAPEDIPVALSPYGQTTTGRHMPGSTGLGLPLVKCMAELHGGTILIESKIGAGTTVTIRLPGARFVQSSGVSMA